MYVVLPRNQHAVRVSVTGWENVTVASGGRDAIVVAKEKPLALETPPVSGGQSPGGTEAQVRGPPEAAAGGRGTCRPAIRSPERRWWGSTAPGSGSGRSSGRSAKAPACWETPNREGRFPGWPTDNRWTGGRYLARLNRCRHK